MNRFLLSFVFLLSLLFAFSEPEAFSQDSNKEIIERIETFNNSRLLKGTQNTIDDLQDRYCSDAGVVEIYVNPDEINADTDYFIWKIYTFVGGVVEEHDTWFTSIGSAPNNGIAFDISATTGYYGNTIYIEYRPVENGDLRSSELDATTVYKTAEAYDFGSDMEICQNSSAPNLVLENSESGYEYFLFKDGVQQSGLVPEGSDGTPINFSINTSEIGTFVYMVEARRKDAPDCPVQMNGSPEITVFPNPAPSPQSRPQGGNSGDPFCAGTPFELYDENPEVSGYVYTWFGPGLPSGGQEGHTITVTDDATINDANTHLYTLTISDNNNSADCEASADVNVDVHERPEVAPFVDPVCENGTATIYANPTKGSGDYSFSWTSNPAGFTSTDENPQITDATIGDDDIEYIVEVTDNVTGCAAFNSGSTSLVINETPEVTLDDQVACQEDGPVTFTAVVSNTGTFEYEWFFDNNPAGDNSSTLSVPVPGTPGIYDVEVRVRDISNPTNCETVETAQLTVNDKPEVSIDDPIEVCNGTSSFTLTADFDSGEGVFPDDYDISWTTPSGTSTETTETLTLNNLDETHEGDYSVTIQHKTTGCSDTYIHSLTVHTIDAALTATSEEICADDNVTFTASGADADQYRFLLNGAEVQAFSSVNTWSSNTLSDGDQVTVEITDIYGCFDVSEPVLMTVNERPEVTTDNNGPYCEGFIPVELSSVPSGGSGDYTYNWTGPDGYTSSDQNPNRGEATVDMTGTYELIVTDNLGCSSDPSATDLVVNALPNASATNDGPKCGNGNEDITLEGDPNGMDSYEWFAPGADLSTDAPIGTNQDFVLSNVLPGNSGIYTLRVVNNNGCVNISTTEVIINELPEVSLGSDLDACIGEDVTLTASITNATTGSYTYTWFVDTGSGWTTLDSGVDMDTYTLTDVQLSDDASYSVIVNDGNTCASSRDALILTVNELPTVTPATTDICAGVDNDILLEGGPDNPDYSYSWSGPGLTGSVDGQDISVTDDAITSIPGTYTYTLTILDNTTGCTNSATVDAEVFENPNVSIDPVAEICDGGQFTVTANVSGGSGTYDYSWTFDDGSGPVALAYDTNTFTVDPASLSDAGTYEVTVTDTGNPTGCSSTASVAVVVNELPIVNLPDVFTCDGQDVTMEATASAGGGNYVNYTWYDASNAEIASGASNELTLTGDDVALANNGATYSVTVEDDNGCISTADDMTLTVNENPSVEILYNTNPETAIDVCLGSSMTLDAQGSDGTGTYTYTWELPDGSTQTGAQLVVDPMALTDDGVYTVTVDDGNCTGSQSIDVTVVEVIATIAVTAPEADATTICENTEVNFEASGGDSYEFHFIDASTGTTTMVHDTSNEWTTSTLENGDQVYVTATNSLGCSDDSDSITMTVIDNPTVAIDYPAGKDNEVCAGEDLSVVADPAGYANYDFYIFDGTDHIKVSPDGYISEAFTYPSDSFNDGDEFYVVASSGAGCSGESAHETVVVHELPDATAANSGPECVNQTITLEGGDAGLTTYEWFASGAELSTDPPIGSSMDLDIENIESTDAGIYTLRVTDPNGCQATATTEVVVNELPEVSLPDDYSVCEGIENHEITATISSGVAPYDVVWEFDDGSGSTEILTETLTGEGESTYTISTIATANEGTYTVTVTDDNGCVSVQDDLVLTVDPAPRVTFDASSVAEVCDGTQVSLVAVGDDGVISGSDPSGYEYVWYHEGTVVTGVSTATYQFSGENGINDGLYEVIAIDDNGSGCESPMASINVTVHELPDATLDVDPAFFIEGTEVTFTAVAGYTSYEFEVNGTNVQGPDGNNTYVSSSLVDQDEVTVIVQEDHGVVQCENSSTVTMTVFDSVDKPDVTVTDEEYCEGSAGATVTVDNPQQDVSYELVYDDGSSVSGFLPIVHDGTNSVSWSGVPDDNGGTSTPTTFRVKAFWAALTPDGDQLSDPFDITEHPAPVAHIMTVEGTTVPSGGRVETVCDPGSGGYSIGLEDSWSSDEYVLVLNGTQTLEVATGGPVPFVFNGLYSYVGTYTIYATNSNNCRTDMIGSFTIDGDAVTIFDLVGEDNGLYCEDDTDGVELTLSSSETGVDYELLRDGVSVDTFTGDGNALSLGSYTEEGQYSVQVTTSGGCIYPMNEVVDVEMIPSPEAGNLTATNNGHYCAGGTGVDITLEITQEEGVTYQLLDVNTGTLIGSSVDGTAGGGDITFETDYTTEGTYQVQALSGSIGCPAFSNEITVVADSLPDTNLSLAVINEKCGSGSANIGIENSETDVEYRWENISTGTVGSSWESGNGDVLSFEVLEAGDYIFHARRTGTVTACTAELTDSVEVVERPLPDSSVTVSTEGGTGCDDGVEFTIDNPEADVEYQLYKLDNSGEPVYVQNPVSGDGLTSLTFDEPIVDSDANYYIEATSSYGCFITLDGGPWEVDISGAVEKFALKPESGDICNGEDGIVFYLDNSVSGVDYILSLEGAGDTRNDTVTSTGGMVEFAPVLEEGTYYVTGLSADDEACNSEMLNRVELIVRPLPKAFNMTGSGKYCDASDGVTLGIDNSQDGFQYLLQQHTSAGKRNIETLTSSTEGDTIMFSERLFENADANIYSVVAISPFGCTSSMKDSIEVEFTEAPDVPVFSEDTVRYCNVDRSIAISPESTQANATYYVNDENDVNVLEVTAGSGDVELGPLTEGKYTIRASWEGGGCMTAPSDTVFVEEYVMPIPGSGLDYDSRVCYGDSASIVYTIDPEYNWEYNLVDGFDENRNIVLPEDSATWNSADNTLTWAVGQTGQYYIEISNGVCDSEFSSKIDIEVADQIMMPSFTKTTYSYCHNDDRVTIEITDVADVADGSFVYRLIDADGNTFGAVFNDDTNLTFEPVVGGDSPSAYGLFARDISSGCEDSTDVVDFVDVVEYPTPDVFNVSPTDSVFNPDDGGVQIELDNSQDEVDYFLMYDGESTPVDTIHVGIGEGGNEISFDPVVRSGLYEVYAKFSTRDCDWSPMSGTSSLIEEGINNYRGQVQRNYCEDDPNSVIVSLVDSDNGVLYKLMRSVDGSGEVFITERTGDGGMISFKDDVSSANYEKELTYTIIAESEGAVIPMNQGGDPLVSTVWYRPSVQSFTIQNGGGQCNEEYPLELELDSAERGYSYQLQYNPDSRLQTNSFEDEQMAQQYSGNGEYPSWTVTKAGDYRVVPFNSGCYASEPYDIKSVSVFRDPVANDFLLRIPENEILGVVNVMEGGDTDPRLEDIDYRYEWVYPIPVDTTAFSFIDATVEFNYDEFNGDRFEGSPYIQYTRPAGFIGKDSIEYRINIGVCPEFKVDTGLITVIVGNEVLPNEDEILIPNAFSPNGDGMNDYFVLSGVPDEGQTTLMVFNRWGNLVYESEGRRYQNDWDGSANISNMVSIGEDLPNGVYFYIFTVKMTVGTTLETKDYNGYIELRR